MLMAATVDWGTAITNVSCHEAGIPIHVWVDEQGHETKDNDCLGAESHGSVILTSQIMLVAPYAKGPCCMVIVGTDRTTGK